MQDRFISDGDLYRGEIMKRICSWCKHEIDKHDLPTGDPIPEQPTKPATHGICLLCRDKLEFENTELIRAEMNNLAVYLNGGETRGRIRALMLFLGLKGYQHVAGMLNGSKPIPRNAWRIVRNKLKEMRK